MSIRLQKKNIGIILAFSLLLLPSAYAEYQVDANTAALWHFDEGSGTIVHDETGINNGSLTSSLRWTTDVAPIEDSSYALNFTQQDYVNASDSQSLSITDNITVEAWVKVNYWTGLMEPIVSKWYDLNNQQRRGYLLYIQSGGKAVFEKSYNGGYEAASGKAVGTTILQLGTWYHLVGTFNTSSREIRIYVNDILEDITNSSYASIYDNTEPLTMGSATATGQQLQYFNGIIDEVRILNTTRAIDAMEVTKVNPVQVIENVDLVHNRTTIVRVTVKTNRNESSNLTVRVYLNGTLFNSTKSNISALQTKDVDVYIIPNISSQNLQLKAEVEANFSGGNNKSSMTILKNITRTRDFKVAFVRVGNPLPPDFNQTVAVSKEFIQKTYPLRDNGITTYEGPNVNTPQNPSVLGRAPQEP